MKTQVGKNLPTLLHNNAATGAAGNNLIASIEADLGGATNATAVLIVDNAAGSDLANVEFWTSRASAFATSGTALAAVSSDSTAQLLITSDTGSLAAYGTAGSAISDLTVSSNTISNITEDGIYFIALRDCSRYVTMQYDSDGTGGKFSLAIIGENLPEAPWAGARTAY